MLIGAGGLAVMYVMIVVLLGNQLTYVSWLLLASIGIYALTLAPVTWVLISEIFPTAYEAKLPQLLYQAYAAYFILVFTFLFYLSNCRKIILYLFRNMYNGVFLYREKGKRNKRQDTGRHRKGNEIALVNGCWLGYIKCFTIVSAKFVIEEA